ncbi:lycopene cyclase domain-containing protein [Bowdeniella nasicola]|uniref:Lycopene cyclase domain-containing protein n=1 Tax=Bowdeniella nasicola TaxID=208480 RepID=A0A1H3VEE8_9ACTO|nr:prenyltransferase [Bowdeniella nasicola]SDZ73173.1 lycopene cyclase domain-containing protein [Bowdeniella nasicola]
MTYPALAMLGLAVAILIALLAWGYVRLRGRRLPSNAAAAMIAAFVIVAALTAIFDNLMIRLDLFSYPPELLAGWRIGLAPIEDFSYPLAGVIALPVIWSAIERASAQRRADFQQVVWASRPVSWINTAFPFGATYLLTTREIDWVLVVGVLYFLIPYNLAMYGINDVFDYASDIANPRKGGIEGALLAPRLHRPLLIAVAITNIPLLVWLATAGGPAAWGAVAVSAFAVVAYSAPRLRFKERPVLDSVTSSAHFVSPAVVGLALADAQVGLGALVTLVAFFLWGMAAHAFGAIQDVLPDRKAGIGSIATALGARRTARFALTLWVIAGLAMLLTPWPGPLAAVLAVPYVLNGASYWNVTDESSARVNVAWRRFIWMNYVSGFLSTLILILVWTSS